MYKKAFLPENRISLKLVQKVTNCYKSNFKNYYFDRFGILDPGCKCFELPSEDNTKFLDACFERVEELSKIDNLRLCFSGGVDSTFVLSLFKAAGHDIKLLHFRKEEVTRQMPNKLLKYVEQNYDLTVVTDRDYKAFDGSTYIAGLADGLFFPTQAVKGGWEYYRDGKIRTGLDLLINHGCHEQQIRSPTNLPNLSFREWCALPGNGRLKYDRNGEARDISRGVPLEISFLEEEIEKVESYVKLFNRPMNSNWSIVRFINFCFSYYQFMFEHPFRDKENTKSFFDTQKFTNIAWTQYWDANKHYPPDKSVEYKFIRKVFGTDFGVKKNW